MQNFIGGIAERVAPTLAAIAGLLFCLIGYIVIYNLYFHPLRKFPGPRLAAATPLYFVWKTISGQKHTAAQKLHEKYGEVVRVKPNELSFIGETSPKDIYGHKQGRGQMQKWARIPPGQKAYSILNAPDDIHARQRKMLSHAFSEKALREQEDILQTYIRLLMSNLHEDAKDNKPVDIVAALNWTTFDIIGDLCFGEPFHNLELRRPHIWLNTLFDKIRIIVILMQLATIPGFSIAIKALQRLSQSAGGFSFLPYTEKLIDRRTKLGASRPDFMSRVLEQNRDDGTGITRDEINATMALLVVAGSETTATLLSGCLYLLLRNPDKLNKLREEILAEFQSADDITILRVNRLPYLFAVLEESLRVYPPVPVSLPRVVPPEGASISGYWVPGGTIVGVPQLAAHNSLLNFVEPDAFLPERWLPQKDEVFSKDRVTVLQPFSTGPRNCLGKNLAYAEMSLILARLLFDFDLELDDEKLDWMNQQVFTLWQKSPMMVQLRTRSP